MSPLVESRIPGLEGVLLKYEGGHITGSFKDRIMRELLRHLSLGGGRGAVVPSSGNAAVAAAAACAAAGVPLLAVVPEGTAEERTRPVSLRGAAVIRVGSDPSESHVYAQHFARTLGLEPLYSTFVSPWSEWACREIGQELLIQMEDRPGTIIAPVSAGPILVGTSLGIGEGTLTDTALIAVQPEACQPIGVAFASGAHEVTPWTGGVSTEAVAIADRLTGYPQDGTHTLSLVRASGGEVGAVSDEELYAARRALLIYDGLDIELSACAGVAWLLKAGQNRPGPVVCILTASGYKHTYSGHPAQESLAADVDAIHSEARLLVRNLSEGKA